MNDQIRFIPESAAAGAAGIDTLFYTLVAFSFGIGLFLTILVVGYAVRYRAGSSADRSGRRTRNLRLEIGWTSTSFLVALGLFVWGAVLFLDRDNPPANALEISAIGKQWMWQFRHPGGQREINELHVPVDQPVVVSMASQDVIHSFYVPAFRVKQDVVPGRASHVWFTATRPGRYRLFCAEFCGTEHSAMGGFVIVMEPAAFAEWLELQGEGESLAQAGGRLFRALGCSGCHGDSSQVRAPRLDGVFGRPVALSNGTATIADDRYIRDSILMPDKEIAAGYEPVMPSYDGLIDESELQMLTEYVRSLSPGESVQ
ncbi:MAG: cytochrome c oxidase subunit II [Alphaproteobacteria bacterium]